MDFLKTSFLSVLIYVCINKNAFKNVCIIQASSSCYIRSNTPRSMFFFIIIKKQHNHKWLTIESIKSYRGLLFSKSACNRNPTVSEMLTIIDHILFVINICFFFIYNFML